MYIETDRLIIRSIQPGDEKIFAEMAKDGSLAEVGFDEAFSDWAGGWINEAVELTEKDDPRADYIPCTILLKSTGEVIGNVGCTYFEDTDRTGICYFAGADYRRKGYVSEAVRAYVQYFFEHYHEDEIIAVIKENNIRSWKVADNTGFRLLETRMYKDIGDENEELYRFYAIKRKEMHMKYSIVDGSEKMSIEDVVRLLRMTYWADKRSVDQIRRSMQNSSCYGVYLDDENKLVGFARVISDYATTYYLCDVIIDTSYRHMGLGKALVSYIESQPEYAGLRGILITRDAHDLYRKYGYEVLNERVMVKSLNC